MGEESLEPEPEEPEPEPEKPPPRKLPRRASSRQASQEPKAVEDEAPPAPRRVGHLTAPGDFGGSPIISVNAAGSSCNTDDNWHRRRLHSTEQSTRVYGATSTNRSYCNSNFFRVIIV